MANFVICHGAWDGGWYWKQVAGLLRQIGHDVYTPTLTGLGEREHLGNPTINLDTHIQDLVNVLVYEDLKEVILVGHSYGGAVITGVAGRVPTRLSELIYIDAFILKEGESMVDQFSNSQIVEQFNSLANQFGNGWKIPFPTENGGDTRHVAQPMATFYQPFKQTNPEAWKIMKKTYIACTERGDNPVYAPITSQMIQSQSEGWPYYELATGHNPNESIPIELTQLLNEIVG